jgi:1-aminocyclopropane-1-carboxylate deaminase/D-cysteine desulfhydrase-like pyridoxal-dependent ACC family enzyme
MADTTKRSPSARSKSSTNSKNGGSKTSSSKRSGSSSGRSSAASNRSRSSRSSSGSAGARSRNASSSAGNGVVHDVAETVGTTASKAKGPLVAGGAAAAGLVGGIVLGSRVLTPRKKVLGVPISRKGLDLKPVAKEVQKAGKQLGRLTDEMAQARKQAKKVGDALS